MAEQVPVAGQTQVGGDPFEEMLVNMGPQHPSTHGVLRLLIRVSGEYVEDCRFHIGYLHRCHEKISESQTYVQNIPLSDRLDYVGAVPNGWAQCLAVEKLAGLEVPARAEYLRVIAAELQRIASHLLFVGTMGTDLGAVTMFLFGMREREMVIDLLEAMSGARLTYHYIRIGGVARDLPDGFAERAVRTLDTVLSRIPDYDDLFTNNRILRERAERVGVIPAQTALEHGFSGPTLRASGVPYDVRRCDPYGIYDRFEFDVPLGSNGDVYDRFTIRLREIEQSSRIVRQALEGIEGVDGPVRTPIKGRFRPAPGWAYAHVEGARGDVGYYIVSQGGDSPYRLKVRSPCFGNLAGLEHLIWGWKIADVVAILGSIDIVLGCVDR